MNHCWKLSRIRPQNVCHVPLVYCFGLRHCSLTRATNYSSALHHAADTTDSDILNHTMPHEYEMYIGHCGRSISQDKLQEIASQCSENCNIQLFRKKRALFITSESQDDITKAESLINENLIQV